MILPENQQERDFAFSVAAMTLRARAQDAAGDTQGAQVFSQARRDLEARGLALYGPRNAGLLEFATVLANQEEKPQPFLDFVAQQDALLAAAREAKREKAAEVVEETPEPEPEPEPEKKLAPRRRTKKETA